MEVNHILIHPAIKIYTKLVWVENWKPEISSRYMLLKNIYDKMEFITNETNDFLTIETNNKLYKKIILETYQKTLNFLKERWKIEEINKIKFFFNDNKIKISDKLSHKYWNINVFSTAWVFLKTINKILNLNLSLWTLWWIWKEINKEINFFITWRDFANIRWNFDKIEKIDDNYFDIEIIINKNYFCDIKNTEDYLSEYDKENTDRDFIRELEITKTKDILIKYTPNQINDLIIFCKNKKNIINISNNWLNKIFFSELNIFFKIK